VIEGTRLYLSDTTAGAWTSTPPSYPAYAQRVGVVTRSHATQGQILVVIAAMAWTTHHQTHETGGSDAITALDGSVITSGTLADARLSANIPRLTVANTFTTGQIIQGTTSARQIFTDPSQVANARSFQAYVGAQKFAITAVNDAVDTNLATPLQLDRTGAAFIGTDVYEKGRPTPIGHWTAMPYSAGMFTAYPSGTWAVDAGDVVTLSYMLVGKTLWLTYLLVTMSVTGAPTELRLALPGGYVCGLTTVNTAAYREPTPWTTGYCSPAGGGGYVRFQKDPDSGTAWATTTNQTYIYGTTPVPLM